MGSVVGGEGKGISLGGEGRRGVDRGGGLGEEARWQGLVPSRTSEKVSA